MPISQVFGSSRFYLFAVTLAGLTANQALAAIALAPQLAANDVSLVTAEIEVGGHVLVRGEPEEPSGDTQSRQLPLSVRAKLAYDERMVPADADDEDPVVAVRYYEQAEATIKSDDGGATPTLPDEHRFMVVRGNGDRRHALTSASGPLQRRHLDLVDVLGNTVAINRILPTSAVEGEESWSQEPESIAALLGLDEVAVCEVESVVDKLSSKYVQVRMAGVVHGTIDGAATEMELRSVYLFHRNKRRITYMNLAMKENRSLGDATPGLDVVAKLKLAVKPLDSSPQLSDEVIAEAVTDKSTADTALVYEAERQGFRMLHDRQWFVTSEDRESVTLRRLDDGDLVAHCTIKRLTPKSADRQVTLKQFQKDVQFSLGDSFEHFASSAEWTNPAGYLCFRVVARGKVEEVPVEWHNYLVASESGPRASVAFTMEGPDAERLGDADRQLVDALELLESVDREANVTAATAPETNHAEDRQRKRDPWWQLFRFRRRRVLGACRRLWQ